MAQRELYLGAGLGIGNDNAVVADLDLDDVHDAVLATLLELAALHAARSVGDVRMLGSEPAQKSFMPPPEPVDSILGILKSEPRPKISATTVANG